MVNNFLGFDGQVPHVLLRKGTSKLEKPHFWPFMNSNSFVMEWILENKTK